MKVIPENAQHVGARKEQQDSFAISSITDEGFISHGGILAIVADGMGGLAEGAKASSLAVKTFMDSYCAKESAESIEEALRRSLQTANDAVYALAKELDQEGNCGTTLIAAVLHDSGLHWIYAGDSRIYLTDGATLQQLTEDQIYARNLEKAVKKGIMDEETAACHPQREALTSFVGDKEVNEVGYGTMSGTLPVGATVMLCSDGLFKFMPESEIIDLYNHSGEGRAQRFVDAVIGKQNKGQDNVTVVCLSVAANRAGRAAGTASTVEIVQKKPKRHMLFFLAAAIICISVGAFLSLRHSEEPPVKVPAEGDIGAISQDVSADDLPTSLEPLQAESEDTDMSSDITESADAEPVSGDE